MRKAAAAALRRVRAYLRLLGPWLGRAALVGVVLVAAARVTDPGRLACSDALCNLALELIGGLLALLVAYAVFVANTRGRLLRRYMRRMRTAPESMLEIPGPGVALGDVQLREDLHRALQDELRSGRDGGALLVVAEAGAGKTTFLLGFAAWLAERGRVPVLVPLRGERPPFDFRALARRRFLDLVDAELGSEADGDRLWRQLCRQKVLVVLADGVDEAPSGARRFGLRDFDQADPSLRIVATSRPDALAEDARRAAFELPALPAGRVADLLARRAGLADAAAARALAAAVDVAGTPFYLDLAREVLASGREVERRGDRDGARAALLSAWTQGIAEGALQPSSDLDADDRREAVAVAGAVALHALQRGLRAVPVDGLAEPVAAALGTEVATVAPALADAVQLGLVEATADGRELRFRHPILLAGLAARALAAAGGGRAPAWRSLLGGRVVYERLLALRLAAVGGLDTEAIGRALLEHAGSERSRQRARLAFATAALRVAAHHRPLVPAALAVARDAYPLGTTPERLRALEALAALGTEEALRLLWELGERAAYVEEWRVAELLADRPLPALRAVEAQLGDLFASCAAVPPEQIDREQEEPLAAAAKFLPSLVEGLAGDASGDSAARERAGQLLRALSDFADRAGRAGRALGIEASLAQGLKHASRMPADPVLDAAAIRLARDGRFWYSRAMAVHALVRRAEALAGDRPRAEGLRAAIAGCRRDRHPFVAEAARLGRNALRLRARGGQTVWHDESAVIARSGHELSPEASRLLADLVLILNMNEQHYRTNPERKRRANAAVALRDDLPWCMGPGGDRRLVLDASRPDPCPPSCGFHLCPYQPQTASPSAFRGHLSPAFCRHQRRIARARRPAVWQGRRPGARRRLARFWAELERVAG